MRKLDRLAAAAAEAIQTGARTDSPGLRATEYRRAAEALVDARESFLDDAGEPDWRGRTYAYRTWTGDVYALAGISPEERLKATAAVRYHVGNVLRERLPETTIHALGLRSESPRERSTEQRSERAALLKAVTGSSTGFAGVDGLRALVSASALLDRVDAASLADLEEDSLQIAREHLARIQRHTLELSETIIRRTRAASARRRRASQSS
jgi:hypothetical protein